METDTAESFNIKGNLTVIPNDNPDLGLGNVEISGTLFTDTINSNTSSLPVTLENIKYSNGSYTLPLVSVPSNPVSTNNTFYVEGSKFKSINSSGIITTYQPTTTKGDIIVNNGSSTIRLPVGITGNVLTVDPTTSTGLKWGVGNNNSISESATYNLTYNSNTTSVTINENPVGAIISHIYPHIINGSSCNLFSVKSLPSITGTFVRTNNNPSINNTGSISTYWPAYNDLQIFKSHNEADGDYIVYNNIQKNTTKTDVVLSGLTTTLIYPSTIGTYLLAVKYNDSNGYGPCAIFYCTKNNSSLSAGNITKITSSPGNNSCNLTVTWPMSGLYLNKTTSLDHNGNYEIVDSFTDNSSSISLTVSLTGTTPVLIPINTFPYYKVKSFAVSVNGVPSGSPCAIFTVSKNINTVTGNIAYTGSVGITTLERLVLTWNVNSLLYLSKNNTGYNGNYNIVFTRL